MYQHMFEMDLQSVKLSFSDLSYIQGLKPDNETYLCGESYWTGVERDIMGCNFKNDSFGTSGIFKAIAFVTDNNSLRIGAGKDDYPDSFGCSRYVLESSGEYIYPACESSYSSSGSSGGAGVWDQSTWDNSVFGD